MPKYQPYFDAQAKRQGSGLPLPANYYDPASIGTMQGGRYVKSAGSPQLDPQRVMGALISQAQTAMDEAKAANIARAEAIRGRYDDLMASTMGDLEGMGAEELAAVNRQYDQLGQTSARQLARAGLASSTVLPSVMGGVEERRGQATRQLNEGLRRERIGYRTGLEGNRLGFEERINETGPGIMDIAQLASMAGTAAPSGGYSMYLPTGGGGRGRGIRDAAGNQGFNAPGGPGVFRQAENTGVPTARQRRGIAAGTRRIPYTPIPTSPVSLGLGEAW